MIWVSFPPQFRWRADPSAIPFLQVEG
jgi:hypothetical protein